MFNTALFTVDRTWKWRRQWHPTPVLLLGKSHGRRSLVGCSPWGRIESDTTERFHFHFSLSCIGEGNGNPLQCSCLENPRDRAAWWAAVYGVAQRQTWLKWLSSSSSSSSRTRKQPICPLTDELIKKLWYIITMEYYSAMKKNAFDSVLMRWTNLEPIIQGGASQKNKYHILNTYTWNLER